jgi:hypothetical protein
MAARYVGFRFCRNLLFFHISPIVRINTNPANYRLSFSSIRLALKCQEQLLGKAGSETG